ncbi:hypothetical protein PsYK624_000450 [Phanerochaete sordida]|uniref:Uncharacterized protein n=1 Tax=Phanerochaete sordida TaxID=48140 RepID=A0A9P3FWT5_9APHY|nr:hypothetical protein PsYK624_000450 [Phanerochaete sordida]
MGQRHQAFIIAKVRPHGASMRKYRCIAAYHSQWCYGTLPLRAAYRVLQAVKQPENAAVIREELRNIDGKYGRYDEEPKIPRAPCPLVATLLGNSWDVDLSPKDMYMSGVSLDNALLHAGMHVWGGDNNDGVTVIDVTNPEAPAYGFSTNGTRVKDATGYIKCYYNVPREDEYASEGDDEESLRLPSLVDNLDIEEYAERWHALQTPENHRKSERYFARSIVTAISDLHDFPLVEPSAMRDAWYPEEEAENEEKDKGEAEGEDKPGSAQAGQNHGRNHVATGDPPSLVDITLRKSIEQAIATEDASGLEDLPFLQDRMHIVDDMLRTLSPFPDFFLPLLSRLVKAEKYRGTSLDLAGYSLSVHQILSITAALPEILSLNLSRNSTLTVADVRELLRALPSLNRLVIINCAAVHDAELVALMHDDAETLRNIHSLLHPALMRACVQSPPSTGGHPWFPRKAAVHSGLPIRMTVVTFEHSHPSTPGVSFPFVAPGVIVQGLTDLYTACLHHTTAMDDMSGGRVLEVAFAGVARAPDVPWHARTAVMPLPLELKTAIMGADSWLLLLGPLPDVRSTRGVGYAFLRLRPEPEEPAECREPAADTEAPSTASAASTTEDGAAPASVAESAEASTAEDKDGTDAGVNYELHDLRSFLRTTEQDGCSAVCEEAVTVLEQVLQQVHCPVFSRQEVDKRLERGLMHAAIRLMFGAPTAIACVCCALCRQLRFISGMPCHQMCLRSPLYTCVNRT